MTEDVVMQEEASTKVEQVPIHEAAKYDIIPVAAAPHISGIYAIAVTKNFRWLFTGGEDGFVRKFDMTATLNGESMLTMNQKQGLTETVQRAGMLVSAWENEEPRQLDVVDSQRSDGGEGPKTSPVYSVDVHSEGVWCIGGTEQGNINLWTVRHKEGKTIHTFKAHKNIVSALKICPGERQFVSGSWDKTLKFWDLDSGQQIREIAATSHVTNLVYHPEEQYLMATNFDGVVQILDPRNHAPIVQQLTPQMSGAPPWALSACWRTDGRGIFVGRRNECVDEFDISHGFIQARKMAKDSGAVSLVEALPNGKHLLCGSNDIVRLWDLTETMQEKKETKQLNQTPLFLDPFASDLFQGFGEQPSFQQTPERKEKKKLFEDENEILKVPFTVIPGHNGGTLSGCIRYNNFMITSSGTRGWAGTASNACLIYEISSLNE
ncbi:WD40-repeat-containing domain protein [Gorgonomyces haynaldii]|nr:WD40-repeat-containing domain protein [Gorgonomyces haynaldii]